MMKHKNSCMLYVMYSYQTFYRPLPLVSHNEIAILLLFPDLHRKEAIMKNLDPHW